MAARGITDRSNHTSSRRRPEPITTWVWRGRDRGPSVVQPGPSCLWVPAQGRDDNGVCCSIRISNIREDAPPRSRGMMYPRCGVAVCSSRRRGRRESRVRAAPAVSCAKMHKETHTSIQVQRKHSGFPCAMGYGLLRALPGDRAFLPPSPRGYLRQTWRQHRGARTTRLHRPQQRRSSCAHPSKRAPALSRPPHLDPRS
jgi:hypothetical protein